MESKLISKEEDDKIFNTFLKLNKRHLLAILLSLLNEPNFFDPRFSAPKFSTFTLGKEKASKIKVKFFAPSTFRVWVSAAYKREICPPIFTDEDERIEQQPEQDQGDQLEEISLFIQDSSLALALKNLKKYGNFNNFRIYCIANLCYTRSELFKPGIQTNLQILEKLYRMSKTTDYQIHNLSTKKPKAKYIISATPDPQLALIFYEKGLQLGEIDGIIYRTELMEILRSAMKNTTSSVPLLDTKKISWIIRASFKPILAEHFVNYKYDVNNTSINENYLKFKELRFLMTRVFSKYKYFIELGYSAYFMMYLCLIAKIINVSFSKDGDSNKSAESAFEAWNNTINDYIDKTESILIKAAEHLNLEFTDVTQWIEEAQKINYDSELEEYTDKLRAKLLEKLKQ